MTLTRGSIGTITVSTAVTLLVLVVPQLRFGYRNEVLHVVLDVAEALVGVLAAYLIMSRAARSRRWSEVLLAIGLGALSWSNMVVGLAGVATRAGDSPEASWAALFVRCGGAVAMAAAPFARGTFRSRPRSLGLFGAIGALGLTIVGKLAAPSLPPLAPPGITPTELAAAAQHLSPAVLAIQAALVVCFGASAVGFLRIAGRTLDPLLDWIAKAAILAAFARVNYLVFPSLYTDFVFVGDVLRLGFWVFVGGGAAAALRTQRLELERRNHQVRELAAVQHEFVASASHELRTPLTSVMAYIDEALDEPELSDEVRDLLTVARRGADRLSVLVADLLLANQIETDALPVSIRPVGVEQLLSSMVATFKPAVRQRSLEIFWAVDVDELAVLADAALLEQVLGNLLTNALKFTPAPGTITLRASTDASSASIEVKDSGMGINRDDLAHVFDRFFRSSDAAKSAIPGTGLGLAITKRMVEQMNGSITVSSVVGQGTTFAIRLPVATLPKAGAAHGAHSRS